MGSSFLAVDVARVSPSVLVAAALTSSSEVVFSSFPLRDGLPALCRRGRRDRDRTDSRTVTCKVRVPAAHSSGVSHTVFGDVHFSPLTLQ